MKDISSNKTLVVNLLAGPGAGKSTIASSVFAELKWLGIDCEIVTEYAKDKVWEESYNLLGNQLYILGQQSRRNFRLDGKVDVMVTDSSVLMSLLYAKEERHKSEEFKKVTIDEFNHYNNLNFFVERNDFYVENGRYHSLEESIEIDNEILNIMEESDIGYSRVKYDRTSVQIIVDMIVRELESNKVVLDGEN